MARADHAAAATIVVVILARAVAGRQPTRHAVVIGIDDPRSRRLSDKAVILRDQAADLQIGDARAAHRPGRESEGDAPVIGTGKAAELSLIVVAAALADRGLAGRAGDGPGGKCEFDGSVVGAGEAARHAERSHIDRTAGAGESAA